MKDVMFVLSIRQIGFDWLWIGFNWLWLALFFPRSLSVLFSYSLTIQSFTYIWLFRKLALFCIKRLICRGFSTVVEGPRLAKSEILISKSPCLRHSGTGETISKSKWPKFKTLPFLPCLANDDFWRVSADTKTCGSPLNICHLYGGLYYTKFQTKVKKKRQKNWPQRGL